MNTSWKSAHSAKCTFWEVTQKRQTCSRDTPSDIIRRSLTSACIPAVLNRNGLVCSDAKWPDCITLVPRKAEGVWYGTLQTSIPLHRLILHPMPPRLAQWLFLQSPSWVPQRCLHVYAVLCRDARTRGSNCMKLFNEMSKCLMEPSHGSRAGHYLDHQIIIIIQRGNVAGLWELFARI